MTNERRRFVRFQVKSPTYAALGHNFDKAGKVKDISMGGFAFEYLGDQESMGGMTQVDIILLDGNIHLSKLPCAVVYERDLKKHEALGRSGRPLVTRQCGVKFRDLAENHRTHLEHFITSHTSGPLP
jgi:c-di-GMP-binding flagellar brake protein YcgR